MENEDKGNQQEKNSVSNITNDKCVLFLGETSLGMVHIFVNL
jgi:hypothetical protein